MLHFYQLFSSIANEITLSNSYSLNCSLACEVECALIRSALGSRLCAVYSIVDLCILVNALDSNVGVEVLVFQAECRSRNLADVAL